MNELNEKVYYIIDVINEQSYDHVFAFYPELSLNQC